MIFALFVLAIVGGSLAAPQSASEFEVLYTEEYKGYNYHVYGQASWFMALEICSANGMRLVRIDEQNKSDDVTYFIDKLTAIVGPYWTLASRLYDDTTWAFGVSDPVKYFNWAPGEPNNAGGNEKCVEIYKNGQWNDKDCNSQRYVLCESRSA